LGVAVFRDRAPEGTKPPFITVTEGIAIVPDPSFSQFDDPEHHVVEEAQISIWQAWKTSDTAPAESYTLTDRVLAACQGARLPTAPTHVAGFEVRGRVRLVERDANLVHDAIEVEIRRTLIHL
jgi:uncharacterized protein (DUF736 family)